MKERRENKRETEKEKDEREREREREGEREREREEHASVFFFFFVSEQKKGQHPLFFVLFLSLFLLRCTNKGTKKYN